MEVVLAITIAVTFLVANVGALAIAVYRRWCSGVDSEGGCGECGHVPHRDVPPVTEAPGNNPSTEFARNAVDELGQRHYDSSRALRVVHHMPHGHRCVQKFSYLH